MGKSTSGHLELAYTDVTQYRYPANMSVVYMLIAIAAGLLVAIAFAVLVGRLPEEARLRLSAIGLAVAAGVYVVFAVVAEAGEWVGIEIVVAITFSMIAFASARSPLLLGLAWALHTGWDVVHMEALAGSVAPIWYPPFCIAFDVALSAYLIHAALRLLRTRDL